MDDVISITNFIQHLSYYVKVAIYINKGTDQDYILDKCIKLHNKLKNIEKTKKIKKSNETFVRKCIKRINLVLKVTSNGKPIDLSNKENQLRMIHFREHSSIKNDNMEEIVKYANIHKIELLSDLPLMFVLRESKYKELLWQYTRLIFYLTQVLISQIDTKTNPKESKIKSKVFDDSLNELENILISVDKIEEKIKLNEILAVDRFLNAKLIKLGSMNDNVNDAREEIKEMFMKKGLGDENPMTKMIDSISNKLSSINLEDGNIFQTMLGIAQNVAQEMQTEMEDPSKFQNAIFAVKDILSETIDQSDNVPGEFKNIFDNIISSTENILVNEDSAENDETKLKNVLDNSLSLLSSIKPENTDEMSESQNLLSSLTQNEGLRDVLTELMKNPCDKQ